MLRHKIFIIDKALDKLDDRAKSDLRGKRGDLQSQINDSDFGKAVSNMKKYESELQTAQNDVDRYSAAIAKQQDTLSEYKVKYSALDKEQDSYFKEREKLNNEYIKKLNDIYKSAGINEKASINPTSGMINEDYLEEYLRVAQANVNNFSVDLDKSSAEVEQYKEALQGVADVTSTLAPEQFASGDYEQAISGIKTALSDVKTYTQEMGFDEFASGITEQLTIAQQGFDNISQAAQSGREGVSNFINDFANNAKSAGASADETARSMAASGASMVLNGAVIDDVVNSYVSTSQRFGASAEQTAVGAALIKNGFYDIASAAKTEGGLEKISQQATEVERSLGKLDGNHSINISANGDITVIDDVTNKVDKIDGKKVDIKLNADGNYEVLNEFGETVKTFDGTAVNVRVNAEGNYEALNEAGKKIAEINSETAVVNIKPGDVSGLDLLKQPFEGAKEQNLTVKGKANYEMGEHPTEAPPIDGVANYTGDFSRIGDPPVKYGTVVYNETFKENAKGTSDFSGGLAKINDQKGIPDPRELVEFGGKGYIFEGKDVVLPLPKHARVPSRYDLMTNEWRVLVDKSLINTAELAEALRLVFCYGFEKGCRCTRKEVTVNA